VEAATIAPEVRGLLVLAELEELPEDTQQGIVTESWP
jgi:hypothetical protein